MQQFKSSKNVTVFELEIILRSCFNSWKLSIVYLHTPVLLLPATVYLPVKKCNTSNCIYTISHKSIFCDVRASSKMFNCNCCSVWPTSSCSDWFKIWYKSVKVFVVINTISSMFVVCNLLYSGFGVHEMIVTQKHDKECTYTIQQLKNLCFEPSKTLGKKFIKFPTITYVFTF